MDKAWHPFDSHNQSRILYDFFDENFIWITIQQAWGDSCALGDIAKNFHKNKNRKWDNVFFYYLINTNSEDQEKRLISGKYDAKTREKVEMYAFEEAFEILEKKLKILK